MLVLLTEAAEVEVALTMVQAVQVAQPVDQESSLSATQLHLLT
jgi:hypothetical protein